MAGPVELREFVCPSCGARTRLDARFVRWCLDCGYGADPNPPVLGKRAQRRAEREQTRALHMYESLRTARDLRPTSASGTAVTALAIVVHVVGFAVLAGPIWLVLATGWVPWADIVLLVGVLSFLSVRPRLTFRIPKQSPGIDREKAPKLYDLLDRCAAELGCETPDRVLIASEFNAATSRIPFRHYSLLRLGMPLWTVLSGPERIALLGHELGHQVNGDPGQGNLVGSARRSLVQWMKLLSPRQTPYERHRGRMIRRSGMVGLAEVFTPLVQAIVFLPFYLVAWGCGTLLTRLDLFCGQRAEYLADELGARLAGSEAAGGLLGKLPLGAPVDTFVQTIRNNTRGERRSGSGAAAAADRGTQPDLWQRLREFLDSIPETEKQRRRIVDKAHNTRTDSSHPANHLRAALMHERPQLPGTIKLSEDEWAGIDAELAPAARAVAKALVGGR